MARVWIGGGIMLAFIFLVLGAVSGDDKKELRSSTLKPVSIPALGRAFSLGDLYDRRRDFHIQGPKIWTNEELAEYDEMKSHSTEFEVSTALTVDESLTSFDIEAEMKLSFMAGMMKASGSASYLDDKKTRNKQARVNLKYSSTTFKRSIRPHTFTKATYMNVLKNVAEATDVVVAIQYGAGAVFVFDRLVENHENERQVEGNLKLSIKKIPSFVIEGEGKVNISTADRDATDKFTCRFHGDFVLKEHPGNYEEAIRVYKALPSLLGENYENSVPVRVWLHPIEMLPIDIAPKVLYDIKQNLITSVADKIEEMDNLLRRATDLLQSHVAMHHSRIRNNVQSFGDSINLYLIGYKQRLAEVLPQIRDGSKPDSVLVDLIEEKENSPFNMLTLESWISSYTEEVEVLRAIEDLPNYCKDDGEFSAKLLNDKRYTVSLTLQLNIEKDEQVDKMKEYLVDNKIQTPTKFGLKKKWWKPGQDLLAKLQRYADVIKAYIKIEDKREKDNIGSDIQFLVREQILESEEEEAAVFIHFYDNGKLLSEAYEIPSDALNPKIVSVSHNNATITWDEPKYGKDNIGHYEVVAYSSNVDKEDCDKPFCQVARIATTETRIQVTGLAAQEDYVFQIETHHPVLGKTAEIEKTRVVQTTKCPPGMYHKGKHTCAACAPGEYSDKYGVKSCLKCLPGTVSDHYANSRCTACPAGTYNEISGGKSSDCLPCPAGTYGEKTGAADDLSCVGCPIGTHNPFKGKTSLKDCLICKKGSYNTNVGALKCNLCPFGSQTDKEGSTSHEECKTAGIVLDQIDTLVADLSKEIVVEEKKAEDVCTADNKKMDGFLSSILKVENGMASSVEKGIADLRSSMEKFHS